MNYLQISENEYIAYRGSVLTLFIYNREFDRDILFDLDVAFSYGVVINRSLATKILWSLAKTYDKDIYPYELWIKQVNYGFNELWSHAVFQECIKSLVPIINENSEKENDEEFVEKTGREISLGLMSNAKKIGLTFSELNLFTVNDFIDFIDIYTNETKTIKKASQKDIDNLFT